MPGLAPVPLQFYAASVPAIGDQLDCRTQSYRVRTGFTGEARSPAWDAISIPQNTLKGAAKKW
jgi:hypothetical protein